MLPDTSHSFAADGQVMAVRQAFVRRFEREPAVLVRVPGCLQLFGAETAVHGGGVLAAATEPAIVLAVAPADSLVNIRALTFGEERAFAVPDLTPRGTTTASPWLNYPLAAAWALQEAGWPLKGMDAALGGDLPPGWGLGATTAVIYGFVLAWEALTGRSLTEPRRRQVVATAESDYLGITANMAAALVAGLARRGHFLHADVSREEPVFLPLPANTAVVLAAVDDDSVVVDEQALGEAAAFFRQRLGASIKLGDVTLADFEQMASEMPTAGRRAAWQVVADCQRLHLATAALQQGDGATLGRLLAQSQVGLAENVGAQPAATALLARVAEIPGWWGGRAVSRTVQMVLAETAVAPVMAAIASLAVDGHRMAGQPMALAGKAEIWAA